MYGGRDGALGQEVGGAEEGPPRNPAVLVSTDLEVSVDRDPLPKMFSLVPGMRVPAQGARSDFTPEH